MTTPTVPAICAVLLVNDEASGWIEGTIEALLRQTQAPREIILALVAREEPPGLRQHLEQARVRYVVVRGDGADPCRLRNDAVAASQCPLIAFVDEAARPDEPCLQRLAEALLAACAHGVAGATANPAGTAGRGRLGRFSRAAERAMGVRQIELIGCLGRSGFLTPVDALDDLGQEPFDVEAPSPRVSLYRREILLEIPFPEGMEGLGADGAVFHGVHLTRRHRLLLVPAARAFYSGKAMALPRRIITAWWLYHTFARRRPLQIVRYFAAAKGLIARHLLLGNAGEAVRGGAALGRVAKWWLRGVSLQAAVGRAHPGGLPLPQRFEPLERQD